MTFFSGQREQERVASMSGWGVGAGVEQEREWVGRST